MYFFERLENRRKVALGQGFIALKAGFVLECGYLVLGEVDTMFRAKIGTPEELIAHINVGDSDLAVVDDDQVLVSLVWEPDGRIIEARHCFGHHFSDADIDVEEESDNVELIRPFVEALLKDKKPKPIKVLGGARDSFLEWTIRPVA